MNDISAQNSAIHQTLFDSAASLFNDYYKINHGKVNIMCMVQDLLLTVQNILAGIALVSQSPVDEYSSNWEIKTAENKPIVVLQYNSLSNFSSQEDNSSKNRSSSLSLLPKFIRNNFIDGQSPENVSVQNLVSTQESEDNLDILKVNSGSDGSICPLDYVSVCITENLADKSPSPSPNKVNETDITIKQEIPEMLQVCCAVNDYSKEYIREKDALLSPQNNPFEKELSFEFDQTKNPQSNCIPHFDKLNNFYNSDHRNTLTDKMIESVKPIGNDSCITFNKGMPERSMLICSDRLTTSEKDVFIIDESSKINQQITARNENLNNTVYVSHPVNLANMHADVNACGNIEEIMTKQFHSISKFKTTDYVHPRENIYETVSFGNVMTPLESCPTNYLDHLSLTIEKGEKENSQHVTKTRMRVPDGKQFFCRFCNKPFKRLNDMKIHERIHTGEKPYSCSYCHKKFSLLHNRKTHELIHTGEKPYACRYCKKTFTYLRTKKYHELCHEGAKPYARNHCNKLPKKNSSNNGTSVSA